MMTPLHETATFLRAMGRLNPKEKEQKKRNGKEHTIFSRRPIGDVAMERHKLNTIFSSTVGTPAVAAVAVAVMNFKHSNRTPV